LTASDKPDDWDESIFGEFPSEEISLKHDATTNFLKYETPDCFWDANVLPKQVKDEKKNGLKNADILRQKVGGASIQGYQADMGAMWSHLKLETTN
jgi:hypothetical protein